MAPTVLKGLEHHALFLLLLQISVLLGVARLLGEIMRKLRQPPVIGELMAGVLLGPSTLGLLAPNLQAEVFPAVQAQADLLSVVAWIGVLFLLIVTGFETDVRLVLQKGRSALMISAGGIIVPFALGLGLGWLIPDPFLTNPERRTVFALFIAVAMSISAVPVIAKVLFDLGLVRRDIGQLTLAAAMTDDTIGWILLSMVAGVATRGTIDLSSVLMSVGAAVAFLLLAFTIGGRAIGFVLHVVDRLGTGASGQLTAVLVIAFGAAAFTQEMGIEAVLGAFVVGILARQASRFRSDVAHTLELVTTGFLAPIFFASAGLKVDLVRLFDQEVMIMGGIVLLIACLGKFVGCYIGSWAGGLSHWERLAMGSGMNARGAMEIIVATVGLSLGVLTLEMYSVIVMVAIVTSLMAPPLLRFTLRRVPIGEEEARRLEREAIAVTSFGQSLRRVLIVARDTESARIASQLLEHIARAQPIEVSAVYADLKHEPVSAWRYFSAQARARANEIRTRLGGMRRALRATGRDVEVKLAMGEDAAMQVLAEARKGYDLVAMTVDHSVSPSGESLFGPVTDRVLRESPCPTLLVRPVPAGSADAPIRRILVPVKGTEHGRNAVEVASLIARGAAATITIVHVLSESEDPLPGDAMLGDRQAAIGADLVEQHVSLARKLGCDASGELLRANQPETAVPDLVARMGFDLLVLGASSRHVQLRAYLGPRVEALLREAPCTVVVCAAN